MVSHNLSGDILKYKSLHDGENLSDHVPILLVFDIQTDIEESSSQVHFVKRPRWNTASLDDINQYKHVDSSAKLNMYCNSIIDACLTASDICIPSTRKKGLAGWRDNAKPARDEAIFWHKLWIENDRPRNGYIADIRRRTRVKYKHIVRMLKREQNNFVSSKMAQSLQATCNNKRPFWNEVKRLHGKSSTVVNNMDSASGSSNICNIFASTYNELYNCVSYDSNKMHVFMSDIEQLVINKCGHQRKRRQ